MLTICQAIKQYKSDKLAKGLYYNANNREYFISYFSKDFYNSMFIIRII